MPYMDAWKCVSIELAEQPCQICRHMSAAPNVENVEQCLTFVFIWDFVSYLSFNKIQLTLGQQ